MSQRAAAMPPEERRRAIVEALVPLIAERGGEVSTREIAEAAGVAEGTIFRVFADKRALMLAAAEEAMNPADGDRAFHEAVDGLDTLRAKVTVAAERIQERMDLTVPLMMSLRRHLVESSGTGGAPKPPEFLARSEATLNQRLTDLFDAHRDELSVEPAVAATALRSLVLGSGRFGRPVGSLLTATQIADLLLDGVAHPTTTEEA